MNTSAGPLISIITVCLNAAEDLRRTLESISSQQFSDFEVIIVDGLSSDDTGIVVKEYEKIIRKYTSEPDGGIYDAMNKGMRLSSGKYLSFLNAGDLYHDEGVLTEISGVIAEMDPDVVYGNMILTGAGGKLLKQVRSHELELGNLIRYGTATLCHQSLFVRKEIAPAYSLEWSLKAELNWYFDILELNPGLKVYRLDQPVVIYSKGGKGYKKFWKNLWENTRVTMKRAGIGRMLTGGYIRQLAGKMSYRYSDQIITGGGNHHES